MLDNGFYENMDVDYCVHLYESFIYDFDVYNKIINIIKNIESKYNYKSDVITVEDLLRGMDDVDLQFYNYIKNSFLNLLILDFCKLDDLFTKSGYSMDFKLKEYLESINANWAINIYNSFMETEEYKEMSEKLKKYRNKRIAHLAIDLKSHDVLSDDSIFRFMETLYNRIYSLDWSIKTQDYAYKMKYGNES